MEFLIQHWHCLFPLAGLLLATFLFRDNGGKQRGRPGDHREDRSMTRGTQEEK